MRKFLTAAACLAAAALCTSPARAQSAGSFGGAFSNGYLIPTKVCQAGDTTLGTSGQMSCTSSSGTITGDSGGLLSADVKLPNGASDKMVLLMASLEDAITTDTAIQGGNGKQTASASGSIVVTPTLWENNTQVTCPDPNSQFTATFDCFVPASVTFYSQTQTLSANLGDVCATSSGAVTCTSPESIELLLSITTANSFNFLLDNSSLAGGTYQLRLGVGVTTTASTTSLSSGATVDLAVGAGSLGALVVQAQTPFDTLALCSPASGSTTVDNACVNGTAP
jgi:hypothetical protein